MTQPTRSNRDSFRITAPIAAVCAAATRAVASLYRSLAPAGSSAKTAITHGAEQSTVLDMEVLQDLNNSLGNEPEVVRSIYMKFIETATVQLHELRAHPHAVNARTLHTLKGSAAMVGAPRVVALAARLQNGSPDLRGPAIHAALTELERELAEFRRAFDAELK
jgi:HPt (histidine-containing phosphotransfer) domain-containing protein